MKTLLIGLFLVVAMSSCKYDANSADLQSLTGTSWVLQDLAGLGIIDSAETTLVIGDNNRISGYGACNRWFSRYVIEGSKLHVQPIGATKRLCPPEMMDQEKRFFDAMIHIQHVELDPQGRLLLFSENYQQPLVFIPKKG